MSALALLCNQCGVRKSSLKTWDAKNHYCSVACQIQHFTLISGKKRGTSECDTWENDVTIPISQIICGQFKIGQDWTQVLQNIECTDIGGRVARSLIRVAATRIFADPAQSALEPVVNSLDAYSPQKNTGKFGMGFFSLLYWIKDDAQLIIKTTYERNGQLCAYTATIYMENNEVYMINLQNAESAEHTGTDIHLKMRMNGILVSNFQKQLGKLRFTPLAAIYVNGALLNETNVENPKVEVSLTQENGFRVVDNAKGISRDVLLGSLIVPTISTKTIQLSETTTALKQYIPKPIIQKKAKSYASESQFLILVNFIVVVELSFKLEKHDFVIALDLPAWTKIPVSRDDVLLSSIESEFETNLSLIIDTLSYSYRTILPLEIAINRFIEQTASDTNRSIAKKTLQKVLAEKKLLLINYKNHKEFKPLQSLGTFITASSWDPQLIEDYLRRKQDITIENNHFSNRGVIFYTPFKSTQNLSNDWLSSLGSSKNQLWSYNLNGKKICYNIDTLTAWINKTKLFGDPTNPVNKESWPEKILRRIANVQDARKNALRNQIIKAENVQLIRNAFDILGRVYHEEKKHLNTLKTRGLNWILSKVYKNINLIQQYEYWSLLKELDFDITKDIIWEQLVDKVGTFPLETLFTKKEQLIVCMHNPVFRDEFVEKNKFNLGQRLQNKFFPLEQQPFSIANLLILLGASFTFWSREYEERAGNVNFQDTDWPDPQVKILPNENIHDAFKRVFKTLPIEQWLPKNYDVDYVRIESQWSENFGLQDTSATVNGKLDLPWPLVMADNAEKIEDAQLDFQLHLEVTYKIPNVKVIYECPSHLPLKIKGKKIHLGNLKDILNDGKEKFVQKTNQEILFDFIEYIDRKYYMFAIVVNSTLESFQEGEEDYSSILSNFWPGFYDNLENRKEENKIRVYLRIYPNDLFYSKGIRRLIDKRDIYLNAENDVVDWSRFAFNDETETDWADFFFTTERFVKFMSHHKYHRDTFSHIKIDTGNPNHFDYSKNTTFWTRLLQNTINETFKKTKPLKK